MRRLAAALVLAALAAPAAARSSTTFVVDGGGWGHGVGMSQYGARGYAQNGWSWERIVAHYYRSTSLGTLPNRTVRVLVAERQGRLRIGSRKPFRRIARRKPATLGAGTRALLPAAVARLGGTVRFEPGASPLRVGDSAYRGAVVVYVESGKLFAVDELSLDHYLRGVVPWEMPHDWAPEALKAQAVVARSYALATLHPGRRFDLYRDTRDQVFGGIQAETPETNRAVAATAGRVVLWSGRVATTYYFSTSGGRTASAQDVWPKLGAVPYLVSVPDPYDALSRFHRWAPVAFTPGALGRRLRVAGLRDVRVVRNASGRAASVQLLGARSTRIVSGQDLRDRLRLRSTAFRVCVLSLQPGTLRVRPGKPLELTGFVRGMTRVRLERAVGAGAWEAVRRVRLAANGRFRTVVRPESVTSYRLAAEGVAGTPVRIGVG